LQQFNKGVFDYLIATDEHWATSEEEKKNEDGEDGEEKKKNEDGDEEEENGEEEEEEDGESSTKAKRSNRRGKKVKKGGRKGEEYGVSRGVDFKDVSAVVNFDFPRSVKAYVHRVGRTARGSASGMALSFVTPDDADMLEQVAAHLESEGREVTPYSFKMSMVEGFRYRVEDTLRSVTRASIKEARVKELKAEILNSQQLKEHFSENQVRATHTHTTHTHTQHNTTHRGPKQRLTIVSRCDVLLCRPISNC
jgi:ATP-dependent RNA helicase DDX56/DBP9